jgi:hypothetical protein
MRSRLAPLDSIRVMRNCACLSQHGLSGGSRTARRYQMPAHNMGVRQGIDLDRSLRLADELEDAEILRKLELRK